MTKPGAQPGNANARRHGHSHRNGVYERSLTYNSWRCMKERCLYPPHKWYDLYGGAGVTISERWLGTQGFANFLADMGERPSRYHTLGRHPEANGNYGPSNCTWQTKAEQRASQRAPGTAK